MAINADTENTSDHEEVSLVLLGRPLGVDMPDRLPSRIVEDILSVHGSEGVGDQELGSLEKVNCNPGKELADDRPKESPPLDCENSVNQLLVGQKVDAGSEKHREE